MMHSAESWLCAIQHRAEFKQKIFICDFALHLPLSNAYSYTSQICKKKLILDHYFSGQIKTQLFLLRNFCSFNIRTKWFMKSTTKYDLFQTKAVFQNSQFFLYIYIFYTVYAHFFQVLLILTETQCQQYNIKC
jgi:hypothetical protein